jgi:hypothetical protein
MASTILWLVLTATLLSVVTYCLFNPPRSRIRPMKHEPETLHLDHQGGGHHER